MATHACPPCADSPTFSREMLRVCRSGGRIGMANWTPDSLVGDMLRTIGKRVPPPQGVAPPVAWGPQERVAELLGPGCADLRTERRPCTWRFPSSRACLEYFRTWHGPTVAAFTAVGDDDREKLGAELMGVFDPHNTTTDGTLAAELAHFPVVGVRA